MNKVNDVVPALRSEYDEVMRELEAEQAEVAEIEKCDQDYLAELKASISEQKLFPSHSIYEYLLI